jgi:hypothetical protein
MMKKILLLSTFTFITLSVVFFGGCQKDSDTPDVNTNMPGVMMTLSSISYAGEQSSAAVIKDSINLLLSDKSLTTAGDWSLVWGPGITSDQGNLMFVAKSASESSYAIAIRGTNILSIQDLIEDLNVLTLEKFPYGKDGDSVSKGAMDGFSNLLVTTDPTSGATLEAYLTSVSGDAKNKLYITGHSLGGALSSMLTYWLITNDQLKDKFVFSTYTFASPGFVNKSFRDNFLASLPSDASFDMKANSLDLVPYGYANLSGIMSKNIPVHVPELYRVLISTASLALETQGIEYVSIKTADDIGNIPITATGPGGITAADSIQWYDYWVGVEHGTNNYLKLVGATPLN